MDLLDFSDCKLYFEEPLPTEAERLIAQAASEYGEASAELSLLRFYLLAIKATSIVMLCLGRIADLRDPLGAGICWKTCRRVPGPV
jgi:hypothetical protein